MNGLKVLQYELSPIRVVTIDSEVYFVGKDVCEFFGDTNYRRSLSRLDDDEKGVSRIETPGGMQSMTVINESGLYSLLFMMQPQQANLPPDQYEKRAAQIKRFKRWITSEVLPSIRKHGAYMTGDTLNKMIASPEFGIQLLTALKDEQNKNLELQAENSTLTVQNAIMQPKAEYFDELAKRNLSLSFRETAKALNVKEKDFINFLLDKRYIYRNKKGQLCPYSERNNGYFEIKTFYNNATDWTGFQTLVTLKGIDHFRMICRGNLTAVWEVV